ncbi:MAG: EAL domain-containing protein, partial [Limnobacter sp.]
VLRRLRGPLDAVIEQAKAITQRRFVMIEEPEVPELKQFATAMNATVGRLKSMFDYEAARLEAVRKEANFDSLTGLANRAYFMACLRETTAEEDSVGGALFVARVANLASVNRSLGRDTTDELLRAFGKGMASVASQHVNSLPARLNGADFALLVPGLTEPHELAERLLQTLVQHTAVFLPNQSTTWVGGVYFPSGSPTNVILAQVDSALAGVQTGGRDGAGVVNMCDMQDAGSTMPTNADEWTRQIKCALDQNWVMLASFPVVSLDGKLLHLECPLRLKFDEQGEWLPAGRFVPVAERLKLTASLDLTAVRLGLQQLQSQPQLPGLAINLSASSLEDPTFQPALLALLDAQREQAAKLWLEVSESGALIHLPALRTLCVALAERACRLGIEHFGHQFSQIGLLHNLGLDYIKVDSSFVCGVDANSGNSAFLRGLCSISHSIGLKVLAEGVSTSQELGALNNLGFDGATGPGVREL